MGKWLYALLFVALLPLGLVAWARATGDAVLLPTPTWPWLGWGLAAASVCLMLEAMRELWVRGHGLPMNAYPPTHLVTSGVYALVPHPIYVGFCALCLGISLATGSSSGLWLVTPLVFGGCIALVLGYEGPRLRERFADAPRPLLQAPESGPGSPTARDRLAVYLLLFLPWLALYEGWGHAQPGCSIALPLPGESRWPVLEWTTYIYTLAYPFTLGVPILARSRDVLHRFFVSGSVATFVAMLSYITLPFHTLARDFDPHAPGGWLLALERSDGLAGAVAFPSFHAVWAVLAACAYGTTARRSLAAWLLALCICAACVTTGMHHVADIASGMTLGLLAWHWRRLWTLMLRACEHVANSWSCVRLGPIRVINYAAYAGVGAALGLALAASLAGPDTAWRLSIIALAALLCAGLWGQLLVGSKTLLRPFGYFGSLLGATAGLGWIGLTQGTVSFWTLAGALATSAPWIVVIGRLRCLVQGCCHGAPISQENGIRYHHPRSRVCRVAHFEGRPLHATPLYSMLANVVIGLLLARLWASGAPLSLVAGVYLLLAGLTRFVEESRRGEPQTQIVAGLRIYQWFAVASILAGAFVTTLASPHAPATLSLASATLAWAGLVGAVYAFAMGMDFPESNRRFSRLT